MISIIIPIYNQYDMTYECIQAIRENTQDCEIIIVDNGSEIPFKVPFTGFIDCKVIRNEKNEGYPRAINQGIADAKSDVIVLLNNDVVVTPGWAEELLKYLDDFSIVGPITNYVAGKQRVQVDTYTNKDELYKIAELVSEENKGDVEEVNWIIGFCMVIKKEVFQTIGLFDTSLWPCCGEEIDFCFRAREAGFKIGIAYDVYVHHEGSQTFQDMEKDKQLNYDELCKRNDKHLAKKWGPDFWQRQDISIPKFTPPEEGTRLNLGCGYDHQEGYVNIDVREEVKPDLVCDIAEVIPLEDNSVDEVRAFHILEHIPIGKTIQAVTEIWRILKPEGKFISVTPSTEGRGAFQDPTHVSFWNKNSWMYYSEPEYRNLYKIKADFEIDKIEDFENPKGIGVINTYVEARARK